MLINFWSGPAPSTSAASYNSFGTACSRASINKKANGKYRQISKIMTVVKASLSFKSKPKKLIVKYFWPNKFRGSWITWKFNNRLFNVPL